MSGSTVYDVKVKYSLDDRASMGVKNIGKEAAKSSEGIFSLKHAMEALMVKEIFSLGKEYLIDFNSEMEKLRIGMTTVMQMNLHMPFEKANAAADKLFLTFQDLAKKSPLTTKDFMEMAAAIAPAVSGAGGGPEKLAKLTKGALTAGLAYGKDSMTTGMAVSEMMMGNARKTNPLAMSLIGSTGMDHNEFNKMDPVERAKLVEKILTDPALDKAADRFGETLVGQASTFSDQMQIALGQVGLPLTQMITAEFKKMNTWIEEHPKRIAEIMQSLQDGIKSAFDFVKGVTGWLVDNRELLFTIGKTFLVFKGAQIGTQVFKKFGEGIGDFVVKLKASGNSITNMFSGAGGGGGLMGAIGAFSGGLSTAVLAVTAFAGALDIVKVLLNTHAAEDKKGRENALSLHEATGELPGLLKRRAEVQDLLKNSTDSDLIQRHQNQLKDIDEKLHDRETMGLALRKIDEASRAGGGMSLRDASLGQLQGNVLAHLPDTFDSRNVDENTKIMKEVDATLKIFQAQTLEERTEILKHAFPEQWGKSMDAPKVAPDAPWTGSSKPNVNITIQKIEVASEDPDRFVFGLVKIGEQSSKHPTSSQHATAGGF